MLVVIVGIFGAVAFVLCAIIAILVIVKKKKKKSTPMEPSASINSETSGGEYGLVSMAVRDDQYDVGNIQNQNNENYASGNVTQF